MNQQEPRTDDIYASIPPYDVAYELSKAAKTVQPPYRLWGFILCTLLVLMLAGYVSPLTVIIVVIACFFHAVL